MRLWAPLLLCTAVACSITTDQDLFEANIVRPGNFRTGSGVVASVGVIPNAREPGTGTDAAGRYPDRNLYRLAIRMDNGGFQTVDPGLANVRAAASTDFVYAFGAGHRSVYELDWRANRAASIWADPKFLSRWVANRTIPLLLGKQEVKRSGAALEHYVPMP